MPIPSPIDDEHLRLLRRNVSEFLGSWGEITASTSRVLDIAPQDHEGALAYFRGPITTLDIDPTSGADVIGDICRPNNALPAESFDVVVCTEVLEHVLRPFEAVAEILRLLRPGGLLLITTPFNFRIHGPLPDCWRFTEHGLRALLENFSEVVITPLETPGRSLMPIHYTASGRRPLTGRDD